MKTLCIVRRDLQKEGVGVLIWQREDDNSNKYQYVQGKVKREYHWLGDTGGFQVKYRNKWYNAYSIDFDFL